MHDLPVDLDRLEDIVRGLLADESLLRRSADADRLIGVLQRVLLVVDELREWRLQAVEAQRLTSQLRATLLPPIPARGDQ